MSGRKDENRNKGPSIKYVTLFLANVYPFPLSYFVIHPGTFRKYVTHLGLPTRFLEGLVQKTRTKAPCTNFVLIVRGVFSRVFVRGSFVWKVLSKVVFVRSRTIRIHLLQQKAKHNFKFNASYV